jgi:hypothetical protein
MKKTKSKASEPSIMPREDAHKILAALRSKYGCNAEKLSSANEANNRLLIIDEILQSLGWPKDDFNPEKSLESAPGFLDYLISTEETPHFIVEAKRTGVTFGHSRSGKLNKQSYTLKYIRSAFKGALSDVVNQALRYSVSSTVPYAVITNGCEWILIQAMPLAKQNIEDLKCTYFGNLLSEENNFDYFWELLAKPNVERNSLDEHFSIENPIVAEFCQTPQTELGDLTWDLATPNSYIRDFYEYFLDEILDSGRRMMLQHCFVDTPALKQYQGDLGRLLRDEIPDYIKNSEAIEAIDISPSDGAKLLPQKTGDQKGKVIIVTGSVGCGKSTFVTRTLFEAEKAKTFRTLRIDLIDEVDGDSDEFTKYLWREILRKWKEQESSSYEYKTLQRIFRGEIKGLKNGPRAKLFELDPTEYVRAEAQCLDSLLQSADTFLPKSWRDYKRTHNKGIVIFLDNIDRASENYQKLTYAFGHKLARETGATVIISMREVTFFRGQKSDFLDVRTDDKVYHLQTPDIKSILAKRLQYAETQLVNSHTLKEKDSDYRRNNWLNRSDWDEFQEGAESIIKTLKGTFLSSNNNSSNCLKILDAIAWHNIRYFLEHLRNIHQRLGINVASWSLSEVLMALMIPAKVEGQRLTLPNIYLSPSIHTPSYFLKIRIVLILICGRPSSELLRGLPLPTLVNFARTYRYTERLTKKAIEEMVRERLIECVEVPAEAEFTKNYVIEPDTSHSYRASPLGMILAEEIQFNPVFLTLVGNEIPFHEKKSYSAFVDSFRENASIFRDLGPEDALVEMIEEKPSGAIVANYLVERYIFERPLGDKAHYSTSVSAVEKKLETIIDKLTKVSRSKELPESLTQKHERDGRIELRFANEVDQLSLLSNEELMNSGITSSEQVVLKQVIIPKSFSDGTLTVQGHLPKIFWALAYLGAVNGKGVIAADVTRMIRQYLGDDLGEKVEPTNIARTLRSSNAQKQVWLETVDVGPRKKLYSLKNEWPIYWQEIFHEPAPEIS